MGVTSCELTKCKCFCPSVTCTEECKNGYVMDSNKCKTCQCIPDYEKCPKCNCDINCDGYVQDSNGCPTCKCVEKICPKYVCPSNSTDCIYGCSNDEFNCPTCNCKACPAVTCARTCEYGYQYKVDTGCPYCSCNEAPVCITPIWVHVL